MSHLCQCDTIVTRSRLLAQNNTCDVCGNNFRASENVVSDPIYENSDNLPTPESEYLISENNNKSNDDDRGYHNINTKLINTDSWRRTGEISTTSSTPSVSEIEFTRDQLALETHEQDSKNVEDVKLNCVCEDPQIQGPFCSNCGDRSQLQSLVEVNLSDSAHRNFNQKFSVKTEPLFGSIQQRKPITNRFSDVPDGFPLYSRIPNQRRINSDIDPVLLEHFQHNFSLNNPNIEVFPQLQLPRLRHNLRAEEEIHNNDFPFAENPLIEDNLADINLHLQVVPPAEAEQNMNRLQNIRPPKFDSSKSNVRTFFTRFDKYREAHVPAWDDAVSINMLSNVLDDVALDFLESLTADVLDVYEDTKNSLIEHYDTGNPIATQWTNLISRTQTSTESVTNYYDDLLKMSRRLNIAADGLLYIFIDGLPNDTKTHLALDANPPVNLAEALARAKTHQAVTRAITPVKTLFKQIRDDVAKPSVAVVDTYQSPKYKNLENVISKLNDKIDNLSLNCNPVSATNMNTNQNTVEVPNPNTRYTENPFVQNAQFQNQYHHRPYVPYYRSNYEYNNRNNRPFLPRYNNFNNFRPPGNYTPRNTYNSGSNYPNRFYRPNFRQYNQNNNSWSNPGQNFAYNKNSNGYSTFAPTNRFNNQSNQQNQFSTDNSNVRVAPNNRTWNNKNSNNPRFSTTNANVNNNHHPSCNHIENDDTKNDTNKDNKIEQVNNNTVIDSGNQPVTVDSNTDTKHIIPYNKSDMCSMATINGKTCKVLFDTGSEITLMSDRFFQTLKLNDQIQVARCKKVKGVGLEPMKLLGQLPVLIEFNDFKFHITVQIIKGIHPDLVLGRDEFNLHVLSINYKNSMIVFNPSSMTKEVCNVNVDKNIVLKGFLTNDMTLLPHTENEGFLHTEAITGDLIFELKGLSSFMSDNSVYIPENLNVSPNEKGIPCVFTNFTDNTIVVTKNSQVAWLRVKNENNGQNSKVDTANSNNIFGKVDIVPKLSKTEHRYKVLAEIREIFRDSTVNVITMVVSEDKLRHNVNDTYFSQLEKENFHKFLDDHRSSFAVDNSELGKVDVIKHTINVGNAIPVRSQPYRVNYETQNEIDRHISEMIEHDIIEPSISPWSSPVVIVKKSDGSSRFCVDFRKLNKVTIKDSYPMPNIAEILDSLGESKYFSTLDLKSGFFQILMDEHSRQYTAFTCKQGLFEFKRLPFGLQNSPSVFSRVMQHILAGLNWKICLTYIDDIVVFSKTISEHMENLKIIFERLHHFGLKLNPKKCKFFQTQINFLGHTVSEAGVSVNSDKINIISNHSVPQTKKQLKSFLGLSNYYRKYIPNVAQITEPLNRLLRKNVTFTWDKKCQDAFTQLKHVLTSAPILGFPNFDLEFQLSVDACATSIGFVLSQRQNGIERVLAYGGRSLNVHERRYSVNELEALSVVSAVKHFHVYLYGRKFTIYTDNTAVQWLYRQKTSSGRISRWIFKLLEYDFEIIYRPGKSNANADAISRIPNLPTSLVVTNNIHPPEVKVITQNLETLPQSLETLPGNLETSVVRNFPEENRNTDLTLTDISSTTDDFVSPKSEFLREQRLDKDLTVIVDILKAENTDKHSRKIKKHFELDSDGLLWKIIKKRKNYDSKYRLVVPTSMKLSILKSCHDVIFGGHRGITATFNKIHDRYYWKNMYNEVQNYCQTCQRCILIKPSVEFQAPLLPLVTTEPFQHVYMDIVGPLPVTPSGNRYILNFVDNLTKWSIAVPLPKMDAPTVGKALYEQVVCKHGTPQKLITDSAKNFTADVFSELCKLLNVKKCHISSFHPQGLGSVEKFNHTLIRTLALYTNEQQTNWDTLIPGILFGYHTTRHSSTKECPFTLLYGRKAKLPNDVSLWKNKNPSKHSSQNIMDILENIHVGQTLAKENNALSQIKSKTYCDKKASEVTFQVGDTILLRNKLKKKGLSPKFLPKFRGPYTIKEQLSPVSFRLAGVHSKMKDIAHANNMKKYFSEKDRIIQPVLNVPAPTPITPVNGKPLDAIKTPPTESIDPELIVLNHRSKNQRMEYLIQDKTEPLSSPYWKKGLELKNNSSIKNYMANLIKPVTRSSIKESNRISPNPDDNNVSIPNVYMVNTYNSFNESSLQKITPILIEDHPSRLLKEIPELVRTEHVITPSTKKPILKNIYNNFHHVSRSHPKRSRLFHLLLIFGMLQTLSSSPNIGSVFDCNDAVKIGIYTIPQASLCANNYHVNDIHHFKAEVRQYQEQIFKLNMFMCTTEKIILSCKETFFGNDKKHINTIIENTPYKICSNAVRFKISPYGRVHKIHHNVWISKEMASFQCKWLRTKHIAFHQLRITLFTGSLIDHDDFIHQRMTTSKCYFKKKFCRPVEKPLDMILWKLSRPNKPLYQHLGTYNVTMIHTFILVPPLGIGGSIIHKEGSRWLLDTGHVILLKSKLNRKHEYENETKKTSGFFNYSVNYAQKTVANIQRELNNARFINDLILENKLLAMISAVLCKANSNIHNLQRLIMKDFSDISHNLLHSHNEEYIFKNAGDALILYKCRKFNNFSISWDQKINYTCFDMFPIKIAGLNVTKFLELRTRRIFPHANVLNCSKRTNDIFIKDIYDFYWSFFLPSNFTRLPKKHAGFQRMNLVLPKLAEFNRKIQHTGPVRQNRLSLLDFLSDNMESIHQLNDFQTSENGNIISGILNTVSDGIVTLEEAGIKIVKTLTKDVDKTLDTITNSSSSIVTTLSQDFDQFISSVGIPNIIFLLINIITILYVFYLHRMIKKITTTDHPIIINPNEGPPIIPRHLKPEA